MHSIRLQELLRRFSQCRVAVLGDYFLDRYLEIDPHLVETSLETGRLAHQVVQARQIVSAAGTVLANLATLGAGHISALGIVGDDSEGLSLVRELRRMSCDTDGIFTSPQVVTPTRIRCREAGVPGLVGETNRYDIRNRRPLPPDLIMQLGAALEHVLPQVDAVILMDQVEESDRGVVTAALRHVIAEQALRHPRVIFWADSRRQIRQFRNVIIKPNQFEAVGRTRPLPGDELSLHDLRAAIQRLRSETGAPVFVTCGEKGMLISEPEVKLIPSVRVNGLIDPTGAGDSATAGAVLTLAAGGTPEEAALVGNLVASVTIQQLATAGTATPADLASALETWQSQHAFADEPVTSSAETEALPD